MRILTITKEEDYGMYGKRVNKKALKEIIEIDSIFGIPYKIAEEVLKKYE
jgi:hypothetical protein